MNEKRRAIALGFFDGIHIGHSALFERVLETSRQNRLIPSVITFDTHPLATLSGKSVPLINSPEDRAGLVNRIFGIDDIIFLHFDKVTANMPWQVFVEHLYNEFGARHLVSGHDYRFGKGGEGNAKLLEMRTRELSIEYDIIPPVKYLGITTSSTHIRTLLQNGDIERANEFLGHPHVLTDMVRYGYRLGRELGTPTINMTFQENVLIPAYGVYATRVFLDNDTCYQGVTNIGVRPTVNDSDSVTAETHILDFQGNLYGKRVRLEFCSRLRPEQKFNTVEGLKTQIFKDCENVREFFKFSV